MIFVKLFAVLFAICFMASVASATTAEDCTNQLMQCVESMCTQAGCSLQSSECICSSAQEAQWDNLIDANCQTPYMACVQQISGSGTGTGGGGGGCCGSALVLLSVGLGGILLARHK